MTHENDGCATALDLLEHNGRAAAHPGGVAPPCSTIRQRCQARLRNRLATLLKLPHNADPDVRSVPQTLPIAGRVVDGMGHLFAGAQVYFCGDSDDQLTQPPTCAACPCNDRCRRQVSILRLTGLSWPRALFATATQACSSPHLRKVMDRPGRKS